MTGGASWIFIAVIGAVIGAYYLYRRGSLLWLKGLKGLKMPKIFKPKAETQIERLKAATEKEKEKVEELRSVLEAKRERDSVLAEKARLIKEIESVSPKSMEKDSQAEKKAQDAEKVKPRRL